MAKFKETHTVHDPFLNKSVEVSSRLVDRLRGRYAVGPTLPNGEPEFGWSQYEVTPIMLEAATSIEQLCAIKADLLALLQELIDIEGPQPGTSEWAAKVQAVIAKATTESPT